MAGVPSAVTLTPAALMRMTGDALLIIDPEARAIRSASARAVDLIGAEAYREGMAVDDLFDAADGALDRFLSQALSVTDPIPSRVTVRPGARTLMAKARRLKVEGAGPQILLSLVGESALSQRFRLLSEKIEELRREVSRRVAAERSLSTTLEAQRRTLLFVRALSDIDITREDYLARATQRLNEAIQAEGALVVTEVMGKLQVAAVSGSLAAGVAPGHRLDLSVSALDTDAVGGLDQPAAALLLGTLEAACGLSLPPEGTRVLPLSQAGELRGVLVCTFDTARPGNPALYIEADIIAETLGNLIARAEIAAQLIHAQKLHAVGELTGGVAHDFNNVLAIIMGNAELLSFKLEGPEAALAEEICEAANAGADLTARLLAFARKRSCTRR